MKKPLSIWVGFDPRQCAQFAVTTTSIKRRLCKAAIHVYGLPLDTLRRADLYRREHERRPDGSLYDTISQATMSTEFAISRFLVPHLASAKGSVPSGKRGWALFLDNDMLVLRDLSDLFALADPDRAVMCVKHAQETGDATKMGGVPQAYYGRKNWSSVMLFNLDHEANEALTVEMVNSVPGRDLHRFCWLNDDLIGELPPEWNWLCDVSPPMDNPAIVHHTLGAPCLPGYENVAFADQWRIELAAWASMNPLMI